MNTDALSVHHYIIFHIGLGVIFISKKSSEMRTAEQRACVHQLSHEIRPVLRQASSLNVALGHTRQLMWRSQVISRERDPLVCVASLIDHALPPRSRRQIIWLSLRPTVVRWFSGAYLEPHWHRFRWKIIFLFHRWYSLRWLLLNGFRITITSMTRRAFDRAYIAKPPANPVGSHCLKSYPTQSRTLEWANWAVLPGASTLSTTRPAT